MELKNFADLNEKYKEAKKNEKLAKDKLFTFQK